jgi:outer membrane protein assembly factor BamB
VRLIICRFLCAAATVALGVTASAADWPNFRGPNHNGISSETGWNSIWPAEGPKPLWKASVGAGFSSIAIAKGRAYTVGNRAEIDTVYCFDAETGSNVWKFSYPAALEPNMHEGGPSATPTVDGGRVYAVSKQGILFCLDAEKGALLWSTNAAGVAGAGTPTWGFAGSVLALDNLLILDMGGSGAALDKSTGRLVWSSAQEAGGYSTPMPCSIDGVPTVAIGSARAVFGLEPKSGRVRWSFPWKTQADLNVADPIFSGNDVFVSSDFNHGSAVFQIHGTNGTTVWENANMRNHIATSILLDGYVYGVDGQVNTRGGPTLKCLDFATGAEKWNFQGLGGGALIVADHKIIMLSDSGELVVAEASPNGFTPISRAQVLGGKCWTAPTLANSRIYCRNAKGDLICLDIAGL